MLSFPIYFLTLNIVFSINHFKIYEKNEQNF